MECQNHIYSHPQMKNNVTMGLLVAIREGHDVEIFFSADAPAQLQK